MLSGIPVTPDRDREPRAGRAARATRRATSYGQTPAQGPLLVVQVPSFCVVVSGTPQLV